MNEDFINRTLEDHGDRIGKLEQYKSRSEVQISNLCEQIKSLVSIIKKAIGVLVATLFTTLVGFVFWYIQTL